MKTRIIFSLIAFAIGGGLLTSCHHKRPKKVIPRTVVVHRAASLASIEGKTITFDFSQAEGRHLYDEEDYTYTGQNGSTIVYLRDVPWKASHPAEGDMANFCREPYIKFNGNSRKRDALSVQLGRFSPSYAYTYRKSGESTATIKGRVHDGGFDYVLTFETPRSGTATLNTYMAHWIEEWRNIRFRIK